MKKFIFIKILLVILLSVSNCYAANLLSVIIQCIEKTNGINTNILNTDFEVLNTEQDILSSQKEIQDLMNQVNKSLKGNSGWGTYKFHDYQSYGGAAQDWSKVLQMADTGSGTGELGQIIKVIGNQFPIEKNSFNKGVLNRDIQKIYELKSQTVLATRAASQLDYNKIQEQISYQQMLQQQIEKAKDLKSAVDLNNRIHAEGNLINLEILRQSSLANQQQSVSEQANINSALLNAKFLSKQ